MPEPSTEPKVLTDHILTPNDRYLVVSAVDQPTHGGARHVYLIEAVKPIDVLSPAAKSDFDVAVELGKISFQNGPVAEVGTNGVTEAALVAIVLDRLRDFQKGPYACRENAITITKLEESLMWMEARGKGRAARGVEGTSAP